MDKSKIRLGWRLLDKLRTSGLSPTASFVELKRDVKAVLSLTSFPGVVMVRGGRIYRCRKNESAIPFRRISDLSYRLDTINIGRFGRANAPGQSVFYGATTLPIAVGEILVQQLSFYTATVTIGIWKTTDLVTFGNPVSAAEQIHADEDSLRLFPDYKPFIVGRPAEERQFLIALYNWASSVFVTPYVADDRGYMLSAAVADYFLKRAQAFIYRSAKLPFLHWNRTTALKQSALRDLGEFMQLSDHNVALTPQLIDSEVAFETAIQMTMKYSLDGVFYETDTKELIGHTNGILMWPV